MLTQSIPSAVMTLKMAKNQGSVGSVPGGGGEGGGEFGIAIYYCRPEITGLGGWGWGSVDTLSPLS